MKPDHIVLSPQDDVAIALADLAAGATLSGVTLTAAVPRGHKFALRPIAAGSPVRRYGQIIGQANVPIAPGDHVHVQNLGMSLHQLQHDIGADVISLPPQPARTFQGYRRADGRAGVVASRARRVQIAPGA